MKKWIRAASEGANSARDNFDDKIDVAKDNFDFAIDGILKIASDGNLAQAEEFVTKLNGMIDSAISEITANISR